MRRLTLRLPERPGLSPPPSRSSASDAPPAPVHALKQPFPPIFEPTSLEIGVEGLGRLVVGRDVTREAVEPSPRGGPARARDGEVWTRRGRRVRRHGDRGAALHGPDRVSAPPLVPTSPTRPTATWASSTRAPKSTDGALSDPARPVAPPALRNRRAGRGATGPAMTSKVDARAGCRSSVAGSSDSRPGPGYPAPGRGPGNACSSVRLMMRGATPFADVVPSLSRGSAKSPSNLWERASSKSYQRSPPVMLNRSVRAMDASPNRASWSKFSARADRAATDPSRFAEPRTLPLCANSTATVPVPATHPQPISAPSVVPSPERVGRILVDRVLPLHGRTRTIAQNGTAGIKYTRQRCCHGWTNPVLQTRERRRDHP